MIEREDAKGIVIRDVGSDIMESRFMLQESIDIIYDSIGSCGECKHYTIQGLCRVHSDDAEADVPMMEVDFCSYFEKKEN